MSKADFGGIIFSEGEKVIWSGKKSFQSMPIRCLLLLSSVVALFQGSEYIFGVIFWGAVLILPYINSQYIMTNKRVFSRRGLFARTMSDAPIEKISDSHIKQGIINRLTNTGDLYINTPGSHTIEIMWGGLVNPSQIRAIVVRTTDQLKPALKLEERLDALEERFLLGEITEEQYEKAKSRLKNKN